MNKPLFSSANILLPKRGLYPYWPVVACDQYTSEPKYWESLENQIDSRPSTLDLILPELYLGKEDTALRIENINKKMEEYLSSDIFMSHPNSMVYVERTVSDGRIRRGIVGAVDLERYDFSVGSKSEVRATEGTVLERIPPRVEIRKNASLELPHIMLLIDDASNTVFDCVDPSQLETVYDTDLICNGGHIIGKLIPSEVCNKISSAVSSLFGNIKIAVGDGNHSLATAKTCYNNLKKAIGDKALEHPARYALAELCNIHDAAMVFEPIHRVVFNVDPQKLLSYISSDSGEFTADAIFGGKRQTVRFPAGSNALAVGALQQLIDEYISENGGSVDYVHGEGSAAALAENECSVAFLLPAIDKFSLFPAVEKDGALPRKTFSLGEANDKRYYLEARRIY